MTKKNTQLDSARPDAEYFKRTPTDVKPPSVPEIEMAVLGAMLIEKEAVPKAIELLNPTSFYLKEHALIFEAMIDLFNADEPIDTVTLYQELKRRGTAEKVGGVVYLSKLSQNISSAANVEYHAKIILEKSILRKLISTSHDIAREAYDGTEDAFNILDSAERKIFEITEEHLKKSYQDMDQAVRDALEYIDALHSKDFKNIAVPTGFMDMDDMLGGFQKSDLIIIAARPSMGKTAFALSLARNAAIDHKVPVVVFSLEMATVQLIIRLICAEGKIDAQRLRTGKFSSKEEGDKLRRASAKLMSAPIYIDDTPAQTILEIRAKARRLVSEKKVGMVVVDYLQLIQGPARAESREREIAHISRSLKALAKELKIPVIALAQLNRAVESRTDKRPQLSDLRESGSIEQDADVVMFIHRPERYAQQDSKEYEEAEGIAEIIIAKQRNGPTGEVKLTFLKQFTRFESNLAFRPDPNLTYNQQPTEEFPI